MAVDEGADRRLQTRFGAHMDVRFARVADAAKAFKAYSLNFSAGGLCLRTKSQHAVGERLEVDVTVEGEHFQLQAEVAWVRGGAIGVRFVNVSPTMRGRLEAVARTLEAKVDAVP